MKTPQELYDSLLDYMDKHGEAVSAWYAGIASDPKERLFSYHNVSEQRDAWAYVWSATDDDARAVEKALLDLGCEGGGGGGSHTTLAVYVYRKTYSTNP
jgi:hypothetical protein